MIVKSIDNPSFVEGPVSILFNHLEASSTEGMPNLTTFPKWLAETHIPALMKRVKSTKPLTHLLVNPLSSEKQTTCTEGMMALWLIEGIRKGHKWPSNNPLCLSASLKSKDWAAASEKNHQKVAGAYLEWWWGGEVGDPLAGSGLHWQ